MIEIINQFGEAWFKYFGLSLVQNTLFLAALFVMLYLLRNAAAQIRYAIGLVGLAKLVLPPFIPVQMPAPSAGSAGALPGAITDLTAFSFQSGAEPALASAPSLNLTGLLLLLWIGGALVYLVLTIVSTARLLLALRGAVRLSDIPVAGSGRVYIYQSNRISVPMTLGIFPRRIFVPASWNRWSEKSRNAAIRHELAHIKRRDGFVLLFQIMVQAICLFHPFVWILNRRLAAYREMACNDASTGRGRASSISYSKCLLEIAETLGGTPCAYASASSLLKTRNELLKRVKYRMEVDSMKRISKKKMAGVVIGLAVLVFASSWYVVAETRDRHPANDGTDEYVPERSADAAGADQNLKEKEKVEDIPRIVVQLESGKKVKIDGTEAEWFEFKQTLEERAGGEDAVIKIVCEPGVTMELVSEVQMVIRELGLTKVSFVNAEGEGMPLVLPPTDIMDRLDKIGRNDILELKQDENGQVRIDGKTIETADVSAVIEEWLYKNPLLIVAIQPLVTTPYEQFQLLLAAVQKAGADRVLVSFEEEFYPFDDPPALVKSVDPVYPDADRKAGNQGEVMLRVLISADGTVQRVSVLNSDVSPAMEQAAIDAVKQFVFEPAKKDGVPVKARMAIPIKFKLQ